MRYYLIVFEMNSYFWQSMKGTRKIFSVLIAVTFLVSSSGIFYVKHTCIHSGKTTIQLSEKSGCCDQILEIESCCDNHLDNSSCTVQNEHKNCCEYELIYLKGDSEFQKSEPAASTINSDYQLFEINVPNLVASAGPVHLSSYLPPHYRSARDILLQSNILIL